MRENKPWFVAKDVAACIEHSDTSAMCKLCRDKDKVVASARDFDSDDLSESGNSRITLISESGLYRILAKCSLPKCEPFENWIFDTVLPSMEASETPIKKSQHETPIIHNQNSYQSPDIGIGSQTFCGVRGYEKEGVAYLHIEDVARGLGFEREKNGAMYVMWDRVEQYLTDLSFHTCVENGKSHDYYIPENIFYRLCMKAKNNLAEAFQAKVADEIIPSIRKTGSYSVTTPALPDFTNPAEAARAWATEYEQRVTAQKALSA